MDQTFFKRYFKLFRNIYSSLAASVGALIFARLYFGSTAEFRRETELVFTEGHQVFAFHLLPLAIVLLCVIMIYYYFDNLDLLNKKDYLEDEKKRFLIARPQYLIGFLISLLFAAPMLTNPIHHLLLVFFNVHIAISRLVAVLTLALIRLVQLYNLQIKWEEEIAHPLFVEKPIFKNSLDIDKFKPAYLFLKPIGYFAIFTLCYILSSKYLIAIVFSVYVIMTSLWQGLLLIALIPFIVFFSVRVLVSIRSRRRLIKKLKRLSREKYARIKYHGAKYISAILPFLKFSIEVTDSQGQVYICNVVCSGKVNSPMYFTTDKYYTEHGFHLRGGGLIAGMGASPYAQVVDISKWGGKTNPTNLILGYRREHQIKFPEKEGNRALIVNPAPTACFSLYNNIANPIDTGENMGKYTVYSATGFHNTIERKCNKDKFE